MDRNKRINEFQVDLSEKDTARALAEHRDVLKAMSNIYYSMHMINLQEDSVLEYTARNEVKAIVNKPTGAVEMMKQVMYATASDEFLEDMLEFSDLTTLARRMQGKAVLSLEFIGRNLGWCKLSFILVEADEEGYPIKVILVTEVVEEEKQREEKLLVESNTDKLTRFLNRRSYEEDMAVYRNQGLPARFAYISADVNGLKMVNDNLSHTAGDELIIGAAACMQQCFGSYGKIYRTGGDEFTAILFVNQEKAAEIGKDFEETVTRWTGKQVKELAVSYGIAAADEFPGASPAELAELADKRMYQAKEAYYKRKGCDRRGQQEAHTVLCALYTKILKINLTTDSYDIINLEENEKDEAIGKYSKISDWLSGFGKSGQVHEADRDEYSVKTNMNYLRSYFKAGKKAFAIAYRRRYGEAFREVIMEMVPTSNYTDGNQELFLYVKPIEV